MTTYIRILAEIVIPVGWWVDDNGVPHSPVSRPDPAPIAFPFEDDDKAERLVTDLLTDLPPINLPLHHDVPPDQANLFPPMIFIYPPALSHGEAASVFSGKISSVQDALSVAQAVYNEG